MTYENRTFAMSGPSDPPNPFFALRCSTSDPGTEAPPARLRLPPMGRGLYPASLSLAMGTRQVQPLKQSSACADRAPFLPLQPGTPDVPAMFAQKGVLRVWTKVPCSFAFRGISALRRPGSDRGTHSWVHGHSEHASDRPKERIRNVCDIQQGVCELCVSQRPD
jgi:hypothetical protein